MGGGGFGGCFARVSGFSGGQVPWPGMYTCLVKSQGIHSGKLPPAEALGSRKGRPGALMGSLLIQ